MFKDYKEMLLDGSLPPASILSVSLTLVRRSLGQLAVGEQHLFNVPWHYMAALGVSRLENVFIYLARTAESANNFLVGKIFLSRASKVRGGHYFEVSLLIYLLFEGASCFVSACVAGICVL